MVRLGEVGGSAGLQLGEELGMVLCSRCLRGRGYGEETGLLLLGANLGVLLAWGSEGLRGRAWLALRSRGIVEVDSVGQEAVEVVR
jgi:hypothetical protein